MKIKRESFDLPVNAVNGNLIFARSKAAAVFRVATSSFEFLSLAEKQDLHGRLSWWAMKAEADFSIYRVCREYPSDAYVGDTVSLIDERLSDRTLWESMLAQHADHMASMRSFTPEVYFVVALQSSSAWSRPSRDLKLARDSEQAALQLLRDYLPANRATTLEIQWLIRRAGVRGVCEPDVDPHWMPPALTVDGGVWSPGRADVQRFMAAVTESGRMVKTECEDGESMQAMLALGSPPKTSDYPGSSELLFAPLESLDFPVDAVVHTRWLSNKKMLSACDDSIKNAHDEANDASARFLDRKTRRRAEEAEFVQDYFASEPYPPGLETFISLAVGGASEDELEDRVNRVKRAYGSVRVYRPYAVQTDLYDDHMLKPDGSSSSEYRRDYKRLLVAEQLAAMMPIGANGGGSESGIYIGHTIPGAQRPVKYNPLEASQLNRAGAVVMVGSLGGGKTVGGQLIATQAAKRGSLVVDVDPRPDHSFEALLGDRLVHVISLEDPDMHAGLLDPLVVAPASMREELAASYMMDLLPQPVAEWQTEIIGAVRTVLCEPRPSSQRVVELLLSSEDEHARAAGKALKVWASWGLCRLAFGAGAPVETEVEKLVTTIKVGGLSLPPAGTPRAAYDQSERVGVATLKLIIALAMRLVSGDRSVHKVLMLDEAHVLADTSEGRRFLSRLIRMSRSMNVTVVLLSQLLGDLDKLSDLIGVSFFFRQETDDQARAVLRMLGRDEDNRALIDMLRGFTDGRCLMRGLDGRVVAMRFDPADPDFLHLADTNPTRTVTA